MTDRDCENCKNYVMQGMIPKDHVPYYGCSKWDCEFEPKEDPDEQSESE